MTVNLDAGTYEILRARLAQQADELAAAAEALNQRRLGVFGSSELRLIGTERIRTANNCVPRDIVSAGDTMVFGYNVFIGLKPQTAVADVFAFHRFSRDGDAYRFEDAPGLFTDPQFERDFGELYRYYKETRLLQLRRIEGRLLAVFQTGPQDIRVLRWAVGNDGTLTYLDNRGERDHVFPPAHDFEWVETTRDDHVLGRHPHISIGGELFVETVGGDLTIKIENNTESGEGVYREPVAEPLQSLADADVWHARVGPLVLLKIRPYKETEWRYLVFNTRTKEVVRLDGIGQACQRLPEDQGIIFPGGYYLTTGVVKTFETDVASLEYERVIRAEEDVLYVFHAREEGRSLLLPYNVIRKEVATPISCHGYSLFDDGTLVVFKAVSDEPTRVHPMQVWQTPYTAETAAPTGTGQLERIGNGELVRGISDCLSITRMVREMSPAAAVFEALIAACERAFDAYHWLGEHDLREPLTALRGTAEQVLDEFENVQELTEQAVLALDEAAARIKAIEGDGVTRLAELRRAQGHLVTLRERRHLDLARLDAMAASLGQELAATAGRVVEHLKGDDAFTGFHDEVNRLAADAEAITTVAGAAPVTERLGRQSVGLETLVEVVGTLDVEATARTAILERVGAVLAGINRARATLDARRRELLGSEGRAAFAAEFALLGQAVAAGLAGSSTPERCDEQLGRLLLQLEGLESRFTDFDDFLAQLEQKREDVYEAFSARKQTLLDERARRADRLVESADRILGSVRRRSAGLTTLDEVNTYFATDPMVGKLRAVAAELRELGDRVRAEELDGRVRAARQEAGRSLRDRLDLFDGDAVRLGRHRFAVNTQPADLTLVPHEDGMAFAITGTDYRSPVTDAAFQATRPFWNQLLVSETTEVYRAEHLATAVLATTGFPTAGLATAGLATAGLASAGFASAGFASAGLASAVSASAVSGTAVSGTVNDLSERDLLPIVRRAAEERFDEGYERGVHDHDAAAILRVVLDLHTGAGLLRYPAQARAAAQFFWAFGTDDATRNRWTTRARSLARARALFGGSPPAIAELQRELASAIAKFTAEHGITGSGDSGLGAPGLGGYASATSGVGVSNPGTSGFTNSGSASLGHGISVPAGLGHGTSGPAALGHGTSGPETFGFVGRRHAERAGESALGVGVDAADYLFEELADASEGFVTSAGVRAFLDKFRASLGPERVEALSEELAAVELRERHQLALAWLTSYAATVDVGDVLQEAVAVLLCELPRQESSAVLTGVAEGLLGAHPRIEGRRLEIRLDEILARTRRFRDERMPAYRAYQRQRGELVAAERRRLRLDEFRPNVMNAFVRNRLLDEVYLPLIGDNLAKQLGDGNSTDQMGMLLLISPPGYGKTTLMEYVASRLGLVFVKVNGPALGHAVTSVDPGEAPGATARQEIEKISFALECGNNVLLYLDDIQHTAPELLQKFISLCDAQRRMEGVWNGRTRTYDLRGKRFAVCMAGNPYTESGQRFRIPDMLANRADVWNLGEVLSGKEDLFALSYIENALTSNDILAPGADRGDIVQLVRLARGEGNADQLDHPYGATELEQILGVLRNLLRVQEVVLSVNRAYIASAAQADASRTEPPFQLQGSYRNMNKLAQRVVPVMNATELNAMIDDHYLGEAQTLTSGAESNLLKLAELRGTLTSAQAARWSEVKSGYLRQRTLGGPDDDPMTRAIGAIGLLADNVSNIEKALTRNDP
ncbi:hypothetical protein Acor_76010 [Acrocarpospora corrugata]|uniref:AAA+ ATPase domain-containing protein n=1 Tax=Acrocarpospora corrugata TaxID=35763 RepID=A0A5M3WEJ2_9ACTN|nr:DNA repair ATPase [Acrocarpospora corrugata]GES05533.1 hypothetical protein Acor_76010 [Acrocarpospora corrugata]